MIFGKGRAKEVPRPTPPTPQEDILENERQERAMDDVFLGGMNAGRSMYNAPDPLAVVKHYAEENEGIVPPIAHKMAWPVFTRALPYSFLTEVDLEILDIQRHIHRIDNLISKPPYEITHEDIRQENLIDMFTRIQAKRAVGFSSTRINERTAQVTQIGQRITTGMGSMAKPKSRGLLGLGLMGL